MVRRTAKCPFGILLNAFCPLPRQLKEGGEGANAPPLPAQAVPEAVEEVVPATEVSLDVLMDELHRAEAAAAAWAQGQRTQCTGGEGNQASQQGRVGFGGLQRRGRKFTGLSQLVFEAGSQLDALAGVVKHSARSQTGSGAALGGASVLQPSQAIPATQPLTDSTIATGGLRDLHVEAEAGQQPAEQQPEAAASGSSLSTCFVPHVQVSGFVWAVVRRAVPAELLGTKRAQRALQRAIRHFVSLRRYEQMSVHQAIQQMRVSDLPWLAASPSHAKRNVPPSEAAARQRTLAMWIGWLFACLVVPVLRAHFFCTESEAYRQQVFYYRKPVWRKLAEGAVSGLKVDQFAPIPQHRAKEILKSRKLGVARLRLLPKRKGEEFGPQRSSCE